jgi:putative SOS response-associated peptidase YedK
MCGRFTLHSQPRELIELFEFDELRVELRPRYNIAPSQMIAVVALNKDGVRWGLTYFKWGFVPHWANSSKERFQPINAKSETVDTLPTFRESFETKRCRIPADGFFEWKTEGKSKQPFHFRLKSRAPFAFAAIWEFWQSENEKIVSTALLTTKPYELVKPVHNRMPVILPKSAYATWLNPDTPVEVLKSLLVPFTAEQKAEPLAAPAGNEVS